jgi:hypothetical protein
MVPEGAQRGFNLGVMDAAEANAMFSAILCYRVQLLR